MTADGRLDLFRVGEVDAYVKAHWSPAKHRSADLIAALGRWGIRRGVLTRGQVERAIRRLPEWWARSELVAASDGRAGDADHVVELLTPRLADEVSDVAIAAAVQLSTLGAAIRPPAGMHPAAAPILEAFGVIPSGSVRLCGIRRSFDRLLGREVPQPDWAAFFGKDFVAVERHALFCYAYAVVDVTAWVNAMDVFNNWLLAGLAALDPGIGTYQHGKVGSFVRAATSRFASAYPAVWRLANDIHARRGESHLSHAWKQSGGVFVRPTAPVPYKYLKQAKPLVEQALRELGAAWPRLRKVS